jgi:hypothetical protein
MPKRSELQAMQHVIHYALAESRALRLRQVEDLLTMAARHMEEALADSAPGAFFPPACRRRRRPSRLAPRRPRGGGQGGGKRP